MKNLAKTIKNVLFLGDDPVESRTLSETLTAHGYVMSAMNTLEKFHCAMAHQNWLVVILDIDSVSLDNRDIRKLSAQYPSVPLLCISRDRIHPELKDAISYHILACLNKPVDFDELIYWLRCIESQQRESPGTTERNDAPA